MQIPSTPPTPPTPQISIENARWILYPKTGKPVVENHQHGRTWKKVYKDNFGAVQALCVQLIPEGVKYFVDPSPFGEYWVFEEFICEFGGSTKHINRNICSKISENTWQVIRIHANKQVSKHIMSNEEIGYQSLNFINKEEKLYI